MKNVVCDRCFDKLQLFIRLLQKYFQREFASNSAKNESGQMHEEAETCGKNKNKRWNKI